MADQIRITKINPDNQSNLKVGEIYDVTRWVPAGPRWDSSHTHSYPVIEVPRSNGYNLSVILNNGGWEDVNQWNIYPLSDEQKKFIYTIIQWLEKKGKDSFIEITTKYDKDKEFTISSTIEHLHGVIAAHGEYDEYDRYVLRSLRNTYIKANGGK